MDAYHPLHEPAMPPTATFPELLTESSDLDRLVELVDTCPVVAIDTEFVRTRTYSPKIGLLQLGVAGHNLCIDPLADTDLTPLWAQLFDPERTSIIHSGKQDMELMWFEQGDVLHNLVDTQCCAALLGLPAQIGYAGLVNELLGLTISKEQTRTDWTRRPLTAAQLQYAAADVEHLPTLHTILRERLVAAGRYEWALEDSLALTDVTLYEPAPAAAWQRLKSIPFLPGPTQARARALTAWREARAVALDKPRQWILGDPIVLQLAEADPGTTAELQRISDLPDSTIRKQGEHLLQAVAEGNERYAADPGEFAQQVPNRDEEKILTSKLMKLVRARAVELDIPAEVLASKRDIAALMRGSDTARVVNGWRAGVIGDELKAAL
jgi:ribonuclease D